MLPCHKQSCAYRCEIPGDCHISCQFDWINSPDDVCIGYPTNQSKSSHTNKWFMFPYNFDPVWGPDECLACSDKRVSENVVKNDPLLKLFALLK
jgi:hypothetical protein